MDIISELCHSEIDGDVLSTEEITSNIALVVGGGGETTRGAILNIWYLLLQHPDQFAAVLADDALWDAAFHETLRHSTLDRWPAAPQHLRRRAARRADPGRLAASTWSTSRPTTTSASSHDPETFDIFRRRPLHAARSCAVATTRRAAAATWPSASGRTCARGRGSRTRSRCSARRSSPSTSDDPAHRRRADAEGHRRREPRADRPRRDPASCGSTSSRPDPRGDDHGDEAGPPSRSPQHEAGYRTYEVYQRERVGQSTPLVKPRQLRVGPVPRRSRTRSLAVLREHYPCYRDWHGNAFWITRYDDVTSVFIDDANFETRSKRWFYGTRGLRAGPRRRAAGPARARPRALDAHARPGGRGRSSAGCAGRRARPTSPSTSRPGSRSSCSPGTLALPAGDVGLTSPRGTGACSAASHWEPVAEQAGRRGRSPS